MGLTNSELIQNAREKMRDVFFLRSYDYVAAYVFFCSQGKHRQDDRTKFTEWYRDNDQGDVTVIDIRQGLELGYLDYAMHMQQVCHVYDDPFKNLAFGDLDSEIYDGNWFGPDQDIFDYKAFHQVSVLYLSLAILYDNFDEAIDYIRNHDPHANPHYVIELCREDLTYFSSHLLGMLDSDTPESRNSAGKWRKQLKNVSKGGHVRSSKYQHKRVMWQSMASEIWSRKPKLSKSGVARIIEGQTHDKWEAIRKIIQNRQ